jgi:hypothetical protein
MDIICSVCLFTVEKGLSHEILLKSKSDEPFVLCDLCFNQKRSEEQIHSVKSLETDLLNSCVFG